MQTLEYDGRPSVRKRDGKTVQPFDASKIERAIRGALADLGQQVDDSKLRSVINRVVNTLPEGEVEVETIQDRVEFALSRHGMFDVAKAYIIYRDRRAQLRQGRGKPDPKAVAEYIHYAKYARYVPSLGRRELYSETVTRVEAMHLRRFEHIDGLPALITKAFDFVRERRVLPSMRSMQFGGAAVEANNNRIYNCSFSFIDRPRVFAEALFLLLSGCGVGFSVQFDHVERLPMLKAIDPKKVIHHTIEDTIEGWSDAIDALVMSYYTGTGYIEFNYSNIRPAGAPLKTSGGRAPGHLKLKQSLEKLREILDGAVGRKLRPIECYDMLCHEADAVLSGGIRRSAMICMFSLEDSEMMNAKVGNWFKTSPWRANSNNSVMLKRDEVKKKQFERIFKMTKEWGEPGFYFTADYDYGSNPCVEIGLNPVLEWEGVKYTGWAFCNLCEINAAAFETPGDFLSAAEQAAVIGTLQSAYTKMPYLGWVSEKIAERESLLGVGITGMLDKPAIALDPALQRQAAALVVETNKRTAAMIGVNPAARTTCVKPSGTTSKALGGVANGHHAHHHKRYILRITANELETHFQHFRSLNPIACVKKPNGDWVIEFPIEAPEGAIIKDDLTSLKFLEMVKSTQENWVLPGTARPDSSPGLTHNVSNTVTVGSGEWEEVSKYLWANRNMFTGVSMLPSTGDKDYAFAPQEAVRTEADEARWNQLVASYKVVDYTQIFEASDETDLAGEAACAGGACSIG